MFEKMVNLQIELLLLLFVGFIIKKKGVIDDQQQRGLSELLINVILPATIIKSFITDGKISGQVLTNCIIMCVICLAIETILILTLPKLLKPFGKDKVCVMEYGLLVPNSGFIGLPVIEYLYDSTALMYASIYLIPLNVTMWTFGLSLFTDTVDIKSGIKKVITHPCIVAIIFGFILMIFNIHLPSAISGTVEMISKASSCISMISVGTVLADIKWNKLFDLSTLTYTALRLIVLPLLVYAVLKVIGVNDLLISLSVLMTAMPCGSTCPVLAQKYNKDYKFAAKLVLLTSIFSAVTVPCLCLLF